MAKLFAAYDEHVAAYDSSIYFVDWAYDPATNNIVYNKKNRAATLEAINHKLGLGFEDYLAKENKKTLNYTAVSPFAVVGKSGMYASNTPLRLNGRPYSGILIGTHLETGERLIEARFYNGIRVGEFKVWTNLGRLHQHSYGRNDMLLLKESAVRKPVIYIYPTQTQMVKVALDFQGELIHSYPKYPVEGWEVEAQPDGHLTDLRTGQEYGYLFWEGQSTYEYRISTGFVVAGASTAAFLDEKLALLGLNRAEATDFITYWLPELESNPYNLIHFSGAAYQAQAALHITPQPETLLRVFMVYQPLAHPVVIAEQPLQAANRQGFTVVEWGGKKQHTLWPVQ